MKAFRDQKRRYFPHLEEDEPDSRAAGAEFAIPKKLRSTHAMTLKENHIDQRSLFDILADFSNETTSVRISSYKRMDWLKRASSEALFAYEDHSVKYPTESEQVSVVELLVPSVFRAVLSLHPAGSTGPDAVAFFSPDEVMSFIDLRLDTTTENIAL